MQPLTAQHSTAHHSTAQHIAGTAASPATPPCLPSAPPGTLGCSLHAQAKWQRAVVEHSVESTGSNTWTRRGTAWKAHRLLNRQTAYIRTPLPPTHNARVGRPSSHAASRRRQPAAPGTPLRCFRLLHCCWMLPLPLLPLQALLRPCHPCCSVCDRCASWSAGTPCRKAFVGGAFVAYIKEEHLGLGHGAGHNVCPATVVSALKQPLPRCKGGQQAAGHSSGLTCTSYVFTGWPSGPRTCKKGSSTATCTWQCGQCDWQECAGWEAGQHAVAAPACAYVPLFGKQGGRQVVATCLARAPPQLIFN